MTAVRAPYNRLNEVDPQDEDAWLDLDPSPEAAQAWVEKYLTVQNEHGQIVPFKCYPQQIRMLHDFTGRDVVVKGRQTRASSLTMAAVDLRPLVTGQLWGATAVIGAQDDSTTQGGFRARIMHHLENDLKRAGYEFNLINNKDETVIRELGNRIVWISGEQRTMSRGYAVQVLHLSELAHWSDKALDLIGGALPAVPSSGRIVFESTPRGEQGAFYEYAMKKKKNMGNLWRTHLYPWWLEPRYRLNYDITTGDDIILPRSEYEMLLRTFEPTDYEENLMGQHGLTPVQILWRRIKKEELDATHAPFLQEYPENLDTCWLGMEGKFFDTLDGIDHLDFYRTARMEPKKAFMKLTYKGDEVSFYGPNFVIWEYPDSEDTYVGAFDAAGGGVHKEADYSVLYIWSVRKEKIVARLRVQASPNVFAAMVCAVGTFYKNATINGESSHHGSAVFDEMYALHYQNIYYYKDPTKKDATRGIYPSQQNRVNVLEKFKTGITGHAISSMCEELVREMNVFTWQKYKDRMRPAAMDLVGMHDDCVFAAAYGWFIIDKVRNRLQVTREAPRAVTMPNGFVLPTVNDFGIRRNEQIWFS